MKQLLKENSKWKNVGWFFRILFMIFALTPGCLTTLSDGLDGLHVEMVFLTMGVGAVCWITKDESLRKNRWLSPNWKLRKRKMSANSRSSNTKNSGLKIVSSTTNKEIGASGHTTLSPAA